MMKTKDNYCIYIHRNIINNKAYIGITVYGDNPNKRWQNGKGYAQQKLFYNAIQKYGWDNFEHIIWADGLTENEAKVWEIRLISLFNTTNLNYGYNISPGGESFNITDVGIIKRTNSMIETKNQNRIQKSIEMFKDRFDSGDDNILQCKKCGAYFEKVPTIQKPVSKRDASKKQTHRISRKYCNYCASYKKHNKKIVTCIDCGIEFCVDARNTTKCRCDDCQLDNRKVSYNKYNAKRRDKDNATIDSRNNKNNTNNTKLIENH